MVSPNSSPGQLGQLLLSQDKLKARQDFWTGLFASYEAPREDVEVMEFVDVVEEYGTAPSRNRKQATGAKCRSTRGSKSFTGDVRSVKRGRPRKDPLLAAKAGADGNTEQVFDKLDGMCKGLGSSTVKRRGRPRLEDRTDHVKSKSVSQSYIIHTFRKNASEMNQLGLRENRIKSRSTRRRSKSLHTDETDTGSNDKENSGGALKKPGNLLENGRKLVPFVDLSKFTTKYIIEQSLQSDLGFKLFKRYEAGRLDRVNNDFVFWNGEVVKEVEKLMQVISVNQLNKYMVESLNAWILMVKESVVDVKLEKI